MTWVQTGACHHLICCFFNASRILLLPLLRRARSVPRDSIHAHCVGIDACRQGYVPGKGISYGFWNVGGIWEDM